MRLELGWDSNVTGKVNFVGHHGGSKCRCAADEKLEVSSHKTRPQTRSRLMSSSNSSTRQRAAHIRAAERACNRNSKVDLAVGFQWNGILEGGLCPPKRASASRTKKGSPTQQRPSTSHSLRDYRSRAEPTCTGAQQAHEWPSQATGAARMQILTLFPAWKLNGRIADVLANADLART